MSFGSDVQRWTDKVRKRDRATFEGTVADVKESIVEGSSVTGSPGQPVAEGGDARLKESWVDEILGDVGTVVTDVDYAPDVEDGTHNGRALTLRSHTGGFHSVALTRAGFHKLVDQVVIRVAGND